MEKGAWTYLGGMRKKEAPAGAPLITNWLSYGLSNKT